MSGLEEQTWTSLTLGIVSQIRRATFLWHRDISWSSLHTSYIVKASRKTFCFIPRRPHTFRPFNTGRIWDLNLKQQNNMMKRTKQYSLKIFAKFVSVKKRCSTHSSVHCLLKHSLTFFRKNPGSAEVCEKLQGKKSAKVFSSLAAKGASFIISSLSGLKNVIFGTLN